MKNIQIRKEIANAGLRLWQVAEQYGYTDSTFSRKLRKELPEEEKSKIRNIIACLKAKQV